MSVQLFSMKSLKIEIFGLIKDISNQEGVSIKCQKFLKVLYPSPF